MKALTLVTALLLFLACGPRDPNVDLTTGEDELAILATDHPIDTSRMKFHQMYYVPIYSDIYINLNDQNALLAATLSIRNTSFNDSLFIKRIDYYDTEGSLVRPYIEGTIGLPPMGTVNYVVDKNDDTGGPGANFIVDVYAVDPGVRPLLEAIMVGQHGNRSFSFLTEGFPVDQ